MWRGSAELAAQAFLHLPRAIVVVDEAGTVLALNGAAERLTGWKETDALGRPCADILEVRTEQGANLFAPEGPLRQAFDLERVVEAPEAFLIRLRTGEDPVRVSFLVAPFGGKGERRALIALEDLGPAQEVIRAKDALILAASHELKTPITVLKANSELLRDYALTEPQRHDLAGEIHLQVERMEKLLDDILSVSRIDSGLVPLELGRVELRRVVERVCEELQPMLAQRRLRTEIQQPLPLVLGEERKLHQILINLGTNAIKYSRPGSEVLLRVASEGRQVRVELRDQGVGIRKQDQRRVFQKFFRVNDPAVRRVRGTGLGLYIVRSLVEMLGGQVEVRSRYGRGTSFIVWLPQADGVSPARARRWPRRRGARPASQAASSVR
jgi:two-component system phosphate regulon sensor histidine kinase PhoR